MGAFVLDAMSLGDVSESVRLGSLGIKGTREAQGADVTSGWKGDAGAFGCDFEKAPVEGEIVGDDGSITALLAQPTKRGGRAWCQK